MTSTRTISVYFFICYESTNFKFPKTSSYDFGPFFLFMCDLHFEFVICPILFEFPYKTVLLICIFLLIKYIKSPLLYVSIVREYFPAILSHIFCEFSDSIQPPRSRYVLTYLIDVRCLLITIVISVISFKNLIFGVIIFHRSSASTLLIFSPYWPATSFAMTVSINSPDEIIFYHANSVRDSIKPFSFHSNT